MVESGEDGEFQPRLSQNNFYSASTLKIQAGCFRA
jgi:hypothetical protein